MKKSIQYLIATNLFVFCSLALAAPASEPAPKADTINILPIGVAKSGIASTAWFLDLNGNQAVWCDAVKNSCSRIVIPQQPNSPSSYIPLGVEAFGSGTGAWLIDTNNKQTILCVHNPLRNDCTRIAYWP